MERTPIILVSFEYIVWIERNYPSELKRKPISAYWQSVVEEVGTADSSGIAKTRNRSGSCFLESRRRNARAERAGMRLRTVQRSTNVREQCDCQDTWNVAAAPFEKWPAIQWATSSMFGTVADTATKRTAEPRAFIRQTTTSRVLPRDSLSIWTCVRCL